MSLNYEQWCKTNNLVGNFEDKRIFEAGHQEGTKKCVEHIEGLAFAYADEHGSHDPETGGLDFRSQQSADYYNGLMELSEELAQLPIK